MHHPCICAGASTTIDTMKKALYALSVLAFVCASCGHATLGKLVGSDRDEHGCIGSAGYTWSDARHDCIRLWEAGQYLDNGPQKIYLVYSTDSTYAEIFTADGKRVLCKRVKRQRVWNNKRSEGEVSINNGVLQVYVNHYTYTRKL